MYLKRKKKQLTILILDSGVGGLSIFHEVKQKLPNANYIYVFDNEAFPYGTKPKLFIINRIIKIINAISKKHLFNMIIIACNTASILSLAILRKYFSYPIIGVTPAIKLAVKLTHSRFIGLLATESTIQSNYIHKLINKYAQFCQIIPFSAPELVNLAEAKLHGEKISLFMLRNIFYVWLQNNNNIKIDTIILGCTHFPLLRREIELVLPTSITIIDSHQALAKQAYWLATKYICLNKQIQL
ncbi:glutamate racemase, partial [Candidatus Palibaumannia cicadellinicola]|uniref:glutamate racemase n=1 Tax=Candidatus Palibaumannia cicadellinicola TaxID=186490 RepID=UPI000C7698BB